MSFRKLYLMSLRGSLCQNVREFEKKPITVMKIIHAVGRRHVDKYREFSFCLSFILCMCIFSDIACMKIILMYKTNMKPGGFDSVCSDSQP